DEYSQTLFEMYRDGYLSGWSVRALPQEGTYGPPTYEEKRARPELEECETVYRKWELAEYSAVAVPGNADALTTLVNRGIWVPDEAMEQARGQLLPIKPPPRSNDDGVSASDDEVTGDDDGEPDEEFRYIRKKGDKFNVYSESGKLLGSHDDRASAVKQLQS